MPAFDEVGEGIELEAEEEEEEEEEATHHVATGQHAVAVGAVLDTLVRTMEMGGRPAPAQDTPDRPKTFRAKAILGMLCAICIPMIVFQGFYYARASNQAQQAAQAATSARTVQLASQFSKNLQDVTDLTQTFADKLTSNQITHAQLLDQLKSVAVGHAELSAFGVAYAPYAYDPAIKLYAPRYYPISEGKANLVQTESIYDYTSGAYDWYTQAVAQSKAMWVEPYFSPVSQNMVTVYSVPFYRTDPVTHAQTIVGVVHSVYALDGIEQTLNSVILGKTGYQYLISGKGGLLTYPIKDDVFQGKSIFTVATDAHDTALTAMAKEATLGKRGFMQSKDSITGANSWTFYAPIATTGWSLFSVVSQDELLQGTRADPDLMRRNMIMMDAEVIALGMLITLLILRIVRANSVSFQWKVVLSYSMVIVAGIGFIWYLSFSHQQTDVGIPIVDKAGLQKFLHAETQATTASHQLAPVYIPTGVFIQSLNFENANDVKLTGYIWQKYDESVSPTISRGIVFPEAIESSVEEAYSRKDGTTEIVGWRFEATLRQSFDYSKYPLDNKDVWLRIWAKDFDKNVVLTPDLAAYDLTKPATLPGIEKDFVLAGWELQGSFFSYVYNNYNTNFGIAKYTGQHNFPELYYTVQVRRDFGAAFLSNLLPIIVISMILFALLLMTTDGDKKDKKFASLKISPPAVLATCSGLFFSVLIAHNKLRDDIPVKEILYLEYFYLLMYAIILLVIVNSYLFTLKKDMKAIQFRDNLLPKLAFWPVMLGVLFICSVGTFYY